MSVLEEIVDRAIDYTRRTLKAMPTYRAAAIDGLKKLRENIARQAPDDAALARLDAYLKALELEA